VLSALWTVEKGWVWVSITPSPEGGVITGRNYFDLERKPLFIATSVLVGGFLIDKLKRKSKGYFGLFELACGIAGAYIILRLEALGQLASWLALAGALTLITNGLENLKEP
jgi:hypothetical protein